MSIEVTLHIYFLTKWQDHVSDVDQSVSDQVTNVKIILIHSQFLIECTEGNPNDKSAVLLKEKTPDKPFPMNMIHRWFSGRPTSQTLTRHWTNVGQTSYIWEAVVSLAELIYGRVIPQRDFW